MANKPTQPVFPLGLAAEKQSTLAGVLNTGTIEHGPDAVLTLPEGNASAGLPSSVRYNADSDEFEGFYENGGWLPLGGGGIRWEVLPHAPTATLTGGRGYLINNTTGVSTVVLPSPTRVGDSVTICDAYGKFATYPLTVSPSGNNLYGSTEDMAITTDNVSATFTWSGPEQGWIITSGVGLGQGRVYSREIFTKILASETSSVNLNTPPTIVDVYADGKRLTEFKYSLDGNVITFSPSLPASTELQVIEYTPIQLGNVGGSSSSTITWVYNGGSAIGGETEITLDVVVDDVPAIDINGSRQYKNLGFTFDPLTSKITLAQELEPEDEVVVIINGTPNIYNQIDYTLREVARVANVKDTEVVYFSVGAALSGYKVIYDKETQRAYSLPADIAPGTTAISLSTAAVLVHSAGSVDLGELAVSREEYVTLSGSFDTGATLNVKNELLTYTTGKYRWDGTLPKTVAPGSTPESTGGVGLGAWLSVGDASLRSELSKNTGLSLIGEESGRNTQEVVNELKTRSVLGYSNPPQINISSALASTPSVESSELVLGANNTLNEMVELIVRVNKVDDIDVYIYGDLASQINTTQAATHVVYGGCDDLERNGYGGMSSGITIVSQSDDKVHIRLAISSLTKDYLAFSYRNQPNSTLTQKVFKMVIKQSGAVIARTHFDFIGGSDKWAPPGVSTKNINFNNEFVQRLQIDRNVSRLKSSGILKISPDGADRYKGDTFSLKFTYNVIRPSFMNFIREVQVMAGEYKEGGISQAFFINSPTRIISIGGYADIYLGQYPSTSDWVQIQSSPRYTFSAPYDWKTNPDPAIRAGTKQPYVGVEVPRWKTKSMRDYKLKQVGSKALVLATDFSYWYDWENKTVYWSFGEVNDTAYIFISEADYGLNVTSSVVCTMSGVRFYGSKDNPVRGYAGSYLSFNRKGGLLSLHNCEVHGSYTGNGFATSNIDSELINCKSFSVNNDGFNAHNNGIMNIVGGGAYHSGDDGASPHENCIMYMQDADFHYSFAGNVTVAFGAVGFGYRLSSIAADNLSTKPYSGTLSVISGQGSGATARFLDCYTDTRGIAPSEYYAQSQEAGKVATIDISRRRRASGSVESVIGGTDTIVSLS